MNMRGKNLSSKIFTPLRVSCLLVFFLTSVLVWQNVMIGRKDRAIHALNRENTELKKSLQSIDDELLSIKDSASDVRIFQRELIKVMKDIDQNYPIAFSSKTHAKTSCGFDENLGFNAAEIVNHARENIFRLSFSQEKLRFETASLLGRAVSMRDTLSGIPSMVPVSNGYVSSDFGVRIDPLSGNLKKHYGIDFAAKIGTEVYASGDGVVIKAGKNVDFGNVIELAHRDGYTSTYGHLSKILVGPGQAVKRGQKIGLVGNTGSRCAGSHLHFGISQNNVKKNPQPFLLSSPPNFF